MDIDRNFCFRGPLEDELVNRRIMKLYYHVGVDDSSITMWWNDESSSGVIFDDVLLERVPITIKTPGGLYSENFILKKPVDHCSVNGKSIITYEIERRGILYSDSDLKDFACSEENKKEHLMGTPCLIEAQYLIKLFFNREEMSNN